MSNRINEIKETIQFCLECGESVADAVMLCRSTGYTAAECSAAVSEYQKEIPTQDKEGE